MSEPVGRDSDPEKRQEGGPNSRNDSPGRLQPRGAANRAGRMGACAPARDGRIVFARHPVFAFSPILQSQRGERAMELEFSGNSVNLFFILQFVEFILLVVELFVLILINVDVFDLFIDFIVKFVVFLILVKVVVDIFFLVFEVVEFLFLVAFDFFFLEFLLAGVARPGSGARSTTRPTVRRGELGRQGSQVIEHGRAWKQSSGQGIFGVSSPYSRVFAMASPRLGGSEAIRGQSHSPSQRDASLSSIEISGLRPVAAGAVRGSGSLLGIAPEVPRAVRFLDWSASCCRHLEKSLFWSHSVDHDRSPNRTGLVFANVGFAVGVHHQTRRTHCRVAAERATASSRRTVFRASSAGQQSGVPRISAATKLPSIDSGCSGRAIWRRELPVSSSSSRIWPVTRIRPRSPKKFSSKRDSGDTPDTARVTSVPSFRRSAAAVTKSSPDSSML